MGLITEETTQSKIANIIINMLEDGTVKPGQRLPSEIELQRILNVPKTQVRSILSRLELHDILTIKPQSGSYLANFSVPILKSLILSSIEILDQNNQDLFTNRIMLEKKAADKILHNGYSKADFNELEKHYYALCKKIECGERGLNEDFMFHISFIKLANDAVLSKLYHAIMPNVLAFWHLIEKRDPLIIRQRDIATIKEHLDILNALRQSNIEKLLEAILVHLSYANQCNNKNDLKELS